MDKLESLSRSKIGREWLFVHSSLHDVIAPNLSSFISAWIIGGCLTNGLAIKILSCVTCTLLFIYIFCVTSQTFSIDEDKLNKPYRPLPAGLLKPSDMAKRIILSNILFIAISWHLHFLPYAISWFFITMSYHHIISRHWIPKNIIFISVGTWIMVQMQWKIANGDLPMTYDIRQIFIIVCIWAGVLFLLQDVRDQDGDSAIKRKTLPLDIGDSSARKALAFLFIAVGPALYLMAFTRKNSFGQSSASIALLCIFILVHWLIAFRTLKYREISHDKKTYTAFGLLYCSTIILLPNI